MEPIVVDVQLTPEDYIAASRLHQRTGTWAGRYFSLWLGLWVIALAIGIRDWSLGDSFVLPAALIGGAVGGLWTWYYGIPAKCRKIFRQQKALQQPYTLEFDDAGMSFRSEAGSSRKPWGDLHKWTEGPEQFLLYYSDIMFTMLPKRSVAEPARLREVLTTRMPARR